MVNIVKEINALLSKILNKKSHYFKGDFENLNPKDQQKLLREFTKNILINDKFSLKSEIRKETTKSYSLRTDLLYNGKKLFVIDDFNFYYRGSNVKYKGLPDSKLVSEIFSYTDREVSKEEAREILIKAKEISDNLKIEFSNQFENLIKKEGV
ncbi:MAG: hypothetical protein PHT94_00905 [Candidatus Nanoarchaeia archaeon]|nr:hypothetical protein [Candidatus Nanoarchaeia archaeon]